MRYKLINKKDTQVLKDERLVAEKDIDKLIVSLQDVLSLKHWTIKHKTVADSDMGKSLMRIVTNRDRNQATIRIRHSLVGKPTKEFGPLLLHELLHLVLDPIAEEHAFQLEYECTEGRQIEYQKRFVRFLEKAIEQLSNSLSKLNLPTEEAVQDTASTLKNGFNKAQDMIPDRLHAQEDVD